MLIIGNKGFIGTNLTNITGWDGIDLPEVDIRDYQALKEASADYDTIIHLGALAGVKQSIEIPEEYVSVNVHGTHNVARLCYEENKRLIFASSSSVYEAKSPYAKTKQSGEDIINAYRRHGLNACILRFFNVFGEYNRKDMAVYKFTQAIREGKEIELYGDCYRDFTYVQDLCKAIKKLPKDLEGTYDMGFGDSIPVMDMIIMLEKVLGKQATVIQKEQRNFDAIATKADDSLMRSLVKQTDLETALRNTIKTI